MTNQVKAKSNEVIKNKEGVKGMKTKINEELRVIKQTDLKIDNEMTIRGIIINKLLGGESGFLKKEFDTYDNVIETLIAEIHLILLEDMRHIVLDMIDELEQENIAKAEKLCDRYFKTVKKIAFKQIKKIEIKAKNGLIEVLKGRAIDIAMLKIDNCYWDISNPLEGLDSIITDLPEYQYFYNEVLDRERKLDLEERVMEDLAYELEYNEDYVIGYDDDKPKIILDDEYYYNNLDFYEENHKDYEFITARKRLLDGEYVLELLYSDSYKDLMDELNVKIFDIAMLIIDNCYLDTTEELEALDSIMVELPEYQDFYNEVINRETKIELEEGIMEDLVIELKYKEDYIIGYKGDKPKIIINARYYDKNRADYGVEYYEDIEFKKTGPDFI